MKRIAVTLCALSLVLFAGGCPQTGAGGADGGGTVTDGGGNGGGSDAGVNASDAGAPDAGAPDGGCGGLVSPSQSSCCTSCTGDMNGCQANGCYGGWWCAPSSCTCAPAPTGCTPPPPPPADGGITDAGPPPPPPADAGTPDAGPPPPPPADAGTPDAGPPPPPPADAGTPDAGPPPDGGYCNGLAEPNTPSCCHSCSSSSGNCQPNGCYGGWMCNPSTCYCKSPPSTCTSGGTDGGTPPPTDGGTPPPTDGGTAPGCTTAGSWPAETGPLACSSTGCYLNSQQGSDPCGKWCWSTKTGTDSDKTSIDLSQVVQTTIAQMDAMQGPPSLLTCGASGGYCSCPYPPRVSPTVDTVYELKNVHVSEIGLEADSDYHMDLDDGQGNQMVAEVPFPGCVGSSSVVGCNISHARAAVDAVYPPHSAGDPVNLTATIIGVGFFDFVHNPPVQGSATNGVEIHPVLRMCFGLNCDPMAAP